ncbi:MAG: hypothetical protein IJX91_02495 [Clostridia bacterium]|nr:hypothetical protein [Clostridia bacterium]
MTDGAAVKGFEVDFEQLVEAARQRKREKAAKNFSLVEEIPAGESLTWAVTPEQVARINARNREALDGFYFANLRRLTFSAYRFMRNNAYLQSVISYEDLLQQVYFDLRTGVLKLRPFDSAISSAVYHSFRYAAVGGDDEVYIYQVKEKRKCQKAEN